MKRGYKEDTPIQSIRNQYVAGAYNFSKFVHHFLPLTKYVNDHEDEILPVLTEGLEPPENFRWMVENCLRTVGKVAHSPLGHSCMSTPDAWDSVEPYKKEWMWYWWVATAVLKLNSQNRWTQADWARVKLRRAIHKAFVKYILPISDSAAALRSRGKVRDPKCWHEVKQNSKKQPKAKSSLDTDVGTSSQPIELWSSDDDGDVSAAAPTPTDEDVVQPGGGRGKNAHNRGKDVTKKRKRTNSSSATTPSKQKVKRTKKTPSPSWRQRRQKQKTPSSNGKRTARSRAVLERFSCKNIRAGLFKKKKKK